MRAVSVAVVEPCAALVVFDIEGTVRADGTVPLPSLDTLAALGFAADDDAAALRAEVVTHEPAATPDTTRDGLLARWYPRHSASWGLPLARLPCAVGVRVVRAADGEPLPQGTRVHLWARTANVMCLYDDDGAVPA